MNNILFTIHSYQGTGGHYYSLDATATALSKYYRVYIVNIGEKPSPVIEKSLIEHRFVQLGQLNYFKVEQILISIIKQYNINIIHSFDIASYLMTVFPAYKARIPIVLTKCGGPLLSKFEYPVVDNIILYNEKEYLYFKSQYKFRNSNIVLLPNRVLSFDCNKVRITQLIEKYNLTRKKIVLRIGRIAKSYKLTAIESINLVKELHKRDHRYCLLIIGNVKDESVADELFQMTKEYDYIYIITEDIFTVNAKELIDIAEIVVGTGRGFMEACQRNKIMFAPCNNSEYPIAVTSENLQQIMANNFSERYREDSSFQTMDDILAIINKEPESASWYSKYFSINSVIDKYIYYYDHLARTHLHLFSLVYPIARYILSKNKFLLLLANHIH